MRYLLLAAYLLALSACSQSDVVVDTMEPEASIVASSSSSSAPLTYDAYPQEESLQSLFDMPRQGTGLTLVQTLSSNASYTRYQIEYFSNTVKVSGIMNIPQGEGPFPLIVLNHGYIDPAVYTLGRGLKREQDYLARAGFAVLHTDYRGHAFGDPQPDNRVHGRQLGYTLDALNAIDAVRRSDLTQIDTERVGMVGHSLGGGVTTSAALAAPDEIDAVVLYAPVSSDAYENFLQYRASDRAGQQTLEKIGTPETNPDYWAAVSNKTYLDRLQTPVRIFHGTIDDSTPLIWSQNLEQMLTDLGKTVELTVYEGQPHEFIARWPDFAASMAGFFNEHLRRES